MIKFAKRDWYIDVEISVGDRNLLSVVNQVVRNGSKVKEWPLIHQRDGRTFLGYLVPGSLKVALITAVLTTERFGFEICGLVAEQDE